MRLTEYFKLIRVQQWYKNLLIFLPIVFVGELTQINLLWLCFLGFISLSLVSSANYIINDIIDLKKDRFHPEKKNRPIASKRVSVAEGVVLAIILLCLSILLAYKLSFYFLLCIIALLVLTFLYTVYLKNEVFMDILLISINFVIRAVAGTFIINVSISPWLILCTFFLSVFLSVGKRHADVSFLGKEGEKYKQVLKFYSKELTNSLLIIATTLLVTSYAFYSFFSEHRYILFTLPFALYVIFRYLQLIYSNSPIARHPEHVFKDLRMMLGVAGWTILIVIFIYVKV